MLSISDKFPLMLVLGLGLKPNFVALALEFWPWTKIQGQNLGRLQNSPLTCIDWSELYFKIHVPYLLTVGNRGLVRVLEKMI